MLLPVPHSTSNEVQYAKDLEGMVQAMQEEVARVEPALLNVVLPSVGLAAITETLVTLGRMLLAKIRPSIATDMVRRENLHNERLMNQVMGIGFGNFSLRTLVMNEGIDRELAARVAENVSLIKSIPEMYHTKLNTVVYEAVSGGVTRDKLAEEIQKIGSVTLSRARIIARDQVAKANGALTQIRQQNLGVTEYVWQTSQDERVRPTHRVKHGKTFRWDSPPPDTGHPGHDYMCRCVANAIIPR